MNRIHLWASLIGENTHSGDEVLSTICELRHVFTFPPILRNIPSIYATNEIPSRLRASSTFYDHIPRQKNQLFLELDDNGCEFESGYFDDSSNPAESSVCSKTHALAEFSPAINRGGYTSATDQRGLFSGEDGSIFTDMGAYEGFIRAESSCFVIKAKNNAVISFCL